MSRWFRVYDDAINDPKVLKLPEAMRWHWVATLCIASKYEGQLPALADVALLLRLTPQKAAAVLSMLAAAGLLDKTETGFRPHNWEGRQYKSDVSNERVKRYRKRKSNAECNVTVTPPDTEDREQKTEIERAEPNGSGADAPRDYRAELFNRGLKTLASLTGKGPDACRSFVGKCLKASGDDAVVVLGLIEDAERNQVVDPSAWIAARLKATGPPVRATTVYQQNRQEAQDILNDLENFAAGSSNSGQANPRLLPGDSGERSEGIRSGPGANVVDLSAGSGRVRG